MRPRPPGRYLSAEVCGPQTPHLTGSVEKPLTMAEAEAPIQKLLSGRGGAPSIFWIPASSLSHWLCIQTSFTATTSFSRTLKKILNSTSASEFLSFTKIPLCGVSVSNMRPRQTAYELPRLLDPDACEIRGRPVLRAAADSILSKHTAPFSWPVSVS